MTCAIHKGEESHMIAANAGNGMGLVDPKNIIAPPPRRVSLSASADVLVEPNFLRLFAAGGRARIVRSLEVRILRQPIFL